MQQPTQWLGSTNLTIVCQKLSYRALCKPQLVIQFSLPILNQNWWLENWPLQYSQSQQTSQWTWLRTQLIAAKYPQTFDSKRFWASNCLTDSTACFDIVCKRPGASHVAASYGVQHRRHNRRFRISCIKNIQPRLGNDRFVRHSW